MDENKVTHSDFISVEKTDRVQRGILPYRPSYYYNRRNERSFSGGSMLFKLFLCIVICAGVLLLEWSNIFPQSSAITASAQEESTPFDEMLGKLKFVELPGIIEVFSSGAKPELNVKYESMYVDESGYILYLACKEGEYVYAPQAGKVKETGVDAELGAYLSLVTDEDEEIIYYGLESVIAEEGQSLSASDTIGKATELIQITVNASGRPTSPEEYFDFKDGTLA